MHTLTFRPGRWALVIIVRDAADELVDEYAQVGGWEQNETTIVKTWHPWDDDTDLPQGNRLNISGRVTGRR